MPGKIVLKEHPGATDFGTGNLAGLGAPAEFFGVYA
jgi:hypothetical protein